VKKKSLPKSDEAARIIELLTEVMRLKAVPRTGWLLRSVPHAESVADHSFGLAFIAMMLADRATTRGIPVNVERVLRMALLHDITEARTGDLPATIKRYFDSQTLKDTDAKIAEEMLSGAGYKYDEIWHEYEGRTSVEARIVKAADKLDLLMQALEYEKGGARSLGEFLENSETDFASLKLDDLLNDLVKQLKESRHGLT
jgi:putative hydrolase of HD superfamily